MDERVHTVRADLDDTVRPDLGTPDLVWASASMHHLARPDRALRTVHDVLAPGGLFAVVELAGFPRSLPETAPEDRPGLKGRRHLAGERHHADHVPTAAPTGGRSRQPPDSPWQANAPSPRTSRAPATVGAYARGSLRRVRGGVADALPPEDLAALDRLLDTDSPHSVLRRDDLAVRTRRSVWAARRGR
ncbi:hypothetical protein GCM10010294_29630 [Streptomyces griseoloalbus]|nr:hypothetical protein GCM10010294_29630 [Streptomyces griseoloalbus]